MRNLKIICQGEVYKIDKPPSLSIKTLKNMTPRKDGKWNIFQILNTCNYYRLVSNFEKHLSAITVAEKRP